MQFISNPAHATDKFVIFSKWHEPMNQLMNRMVQEHIRFDVIDGEYQQAHIYVM